MANMLHGSTNQQSKNSELQAGFRRRRQAGDSFFVVHKLLELSREWERPLTIVRLDLCKAFDTMTQSSALKMLEASYLRRKLIFNIARELVGNQMVARCTDVPTTPQSNCSAGPNKGPQIAASYLQIAASYL